MITRQYLNIDEETTMTIVADGRPINDDSDYHLRLTDGFSGFPLDFWALI